MRKLVNLAAAIMIAACLMPQIGVVHASMEDPDMGIHMTKEVYAEEEYAPTGENGMYLPGDKIAFDITVWATLDEDLEDYVEFILMPTVSDEWPDEIEYTGFEVLHKAAGDDGMGGKYSVTAEVTDSLQVEMYDEDWDDYIMYTNFYVKFRFTGKVRDCLEEGEKSRTITNTAVFEAVDFEPVTDEADIMITKAEEAETEVVEEPADPEEPEEPAEPENANPKEPPEKAQKQTELPNDDVPRTGDSAKGLLLALGMLVATGSGAGIILFRKLTAS